MYDLMPVPGNYVCAHSDLVVAEVQTFRAAWYFKKQIQILLHAEPALKAK
jgi:hypothetical protein